MSPAARAACMPRWTFLEGEPLDRAYAARRLPPGALHDTALKRLPGSAGMLPPRPDLFAIPPARVGVTAIVDVAERHWGSLRRALRVAVTETHANQETTSWLDDDAAEAILNASRAVWKHVGDACPPIVVGDVTPFPSELDWREAVADDPVRGPSIGLSITLAIFSAWTEQPLPSTICASGCLVDGGLRPPDHVAAKIEALQRELPFVDTLILPAGAVGIPESPSLRVVQVTSLPEAIAAAGMDPKRPVTRASSRPEGLLRLALDLHRAQEERRHGVRTIRLRADTLWATFSHLCESVRRGAPPQPLPVSLARAGLHLLAVRIEYLTHDLRADEVRGLRDELRSFEEENPWIAIGERCRLAACWTAIASAFIDIPCFAEAQRLFDRAITYATALPAEHADALTHIGRMHAHAGSDAEAEPFLRRGLAMLRGNDPDAPRVNIAACYLAGVLLRRGDPNGHQVIKVARDYARALTLEGRWQSDNEVYLDYELLKDHVRCARFDDACELAQDLTSRLGGPDNWPLLGVRCQHVYALLGLDLEGEASALIETIDASVEHDTRLARWTAALAHAERAAWRMDHGQDTVDDLATLRAACAEIPAIADGPWVDVARRIAAGDAPTSDDLRALRRADLY